MELRRGAGDDFGSPDVVRGSGEVGDYPARLSDEQDSRCDIPRVNCGRPIAVEAAVRQIGEVKGGRTEPPNSAGGEQNLVETTNFRRISLQSGR